MLLPREHSQRREFNDEVHARPPETLVPKVGAVCNSSPNVSALLRRRRPLTILVLTSARFVSNVSVIPNFFD